jgi:hypothetical protein
MEPAGKYVKTNPADPAAYAICDLCGLRFNHHDLRWNFQWTGAKLYNTQSLRCWRCIDVPQEQLRSIVLPPDPVPILNARVENFEYEEAGPVQSTLSANVLQGAMNLPLVSAVGFEVGNQIWVQLNNADIGQMTVNGVDLVNNIISVSAPMPFSAPYTGVVSVSLPNG